MKKYIYLIILALILGLVLTGCSLLSNIGQAPANEQSGITYLTKNGSDPVLAARWKFDEGSGSNAYDSSVNVNDGEVNGATWVADQWGEHALSFDGNDYVEVPDSSSLDITGNITVEGWIKLTSLSQPATIAGKWKDISSINQRGYLLTVATDGTPRFYVSTDGVNYPRATGPALSINTWYHLAGTYDGANVNLYVGTMPSSMVQAGSIFSNDQPLLIGANDGYGGTTRKFTSGVIDEVRVWRSVLDANQLDDMLPPVVTSPNDGDTYLLNQEVYADWSAVDDDTGSGPGSGVTGLASDEGSIIKGSALDTSTVGIHSFTVTATDYAKNEATETVTYTVIYDWDGFFRPVDNLPTYNSAKAGSAIPVKFSLSGDQGLDIFAAGYPKSVNITCNSIELIEGVNETMTAGSSSLNYDVDADQYIYVWKTEKGWAGTCRQLVVKLIDGTYHRANFTFK